MKSFRGWGEHTTRLRCFTNRGQVPNICLTTERIFYGLFWTSTSFPFARVRGPVLAAFCRPCYLEWNLGPLKCEFLVLTVAYSNNPGNTIAKNLRQQVNNFQRRLKCSQIQKKGYQCSPSYCTQLTAPACAAHRDWRTQHGCTWSLAKAQTSALHFPLEGMWSGFLWSLSRMGVLHFLQFPALRQVFLGENRTESQAFSFPCMENAREIP